MHTNVDFSYSLNKNTNVAKNWCLMIFTLQGQLKYHEDVTEGFDNMFDAFAGLFTGNNLGKAVVKA